MRQQCIQAVQQAIGRTLKPGEALNIEGQINRAMRDLAARDRQAWLGLSQADRLQRAGAEVANTLMEGVKRKKQQLALNILAESKIREDLARMASDGLSMGESLNRMLAPKHDARSKVTSVESAAKSIHVEAESGLRALFEASKGEWLGFFTDQAMMRDLARELHGQDTGNVTAKDAAAAFAQNAEKLRERFNRAGGMVGHLEDWGLPHTHSMDKIVRAGQQAWVDATMPLLNRERYVNEDGSLMTDTQLKDFLGEAYQTLATDGANKIEPGAMGTAARANRHSESRSIHFKDGDSWINYQQRFGENDMLEVMHSHLRGMALDIALVERFGTNPSMMFKKLQQEAYKQAKVKGGEEAKKASRVMERNNALFMEVTRTRPIVGSVALNTISAYRNLNIAGKLGGTTITAITDGATMASTMMQHAGVLAVGRMFGKQLRMLASSESRQVARDLGLGIEETINSLNRYADDGLVSASGWTGWLSRKAGAGASQVMRISGLNALTAANKAAFSKMLLAKYGELTRTKGWDDMSPRDRRWMEGSGVTKQDWEIWQASKTLDAEGSQYLHASSIHAVPDAEVARVINNNNPWYIKRARDQAATRLLAHVLDEQGLAVNEAGAREKALMYGTQSRGTVASEVWRSATQFKSFTVALTNRHFQRLMAQQTAVGKAMYGITLFTGLTVLGAAAIQLATLATGGDPKDMTSTDFWKSAVVKGGGLSILGDILKAGETPSGTGVGEFLLGPMGSDIKTVATLTAGNLKRVYDGKEANGWTDSVNFVKGHIPGMNLWYTRAATDRLIFNQLQELGNPGYLDRMQAKQASRYDQTYWWDQNANPYDGSGFAPDRAPDMGKAIGR